MCSSKKQLREAILAEAHNRQHPTKPGFIPLAIFDDDDVMVGAYEATILTKQFYPDFKEGCLLGQSKNPWQRAGPPTRGPLFFDLLHKDRPCNVIPDEILMLKY